MRIPWFKIALGFCVWYELSVELRIDATTALILAIGLLVAWQAAPRILQSMAASLVPLAGGLAARMAAWTVLFCVVSPPFFRDQPFIYILALVGFLFLIGVRARHLFERHGLDAAKSWTRNHSGTVLGVVLGAVALLGTSIHSIKSPLLIVGYILLPAIPFGYGWYIGAPKGAQQADAKVGDEGTFRDAGLSEDI